MRKNPPLLQQYYTERFTLHKDAIHNDDFFTQCGRTIQLAMKSGQRSCVIVRLQEYVHYMLYPVFDRPQPEPRHGPKSPRRVLSSVTRQAVEYAGKEWKIIDESIFALFEWIRQQGLQWTFGIDYEGVTSSEERQRILGNTAEVVVYWKAVTEASGGGALYTYWISQCMVKSTDESQFVRWYMRIKKAMDMGQSTCMLFFIQEENDYYWRAPDNQTEIASTKCSSVMDFWGRKVDTPIWIKTRKFEQVLDWIHKHGLTTVACVDREWAYFGVAWKPQEIEHHLHIF